jgi:hypothetical protein
MLSASVESKRAFSVLRYVLRCGVVYGSVGCGDCVCVCWIWCSCSSSFDLLAWLPVRISVMSVKKAFYGKQKSLLCSGPCGMRFYLSCLKLSDAEYTFYTPNGESTYTNMRLVWRHYGQWGLKQLPFVLSDLHRLLKLVGKWRLLPGNLQPPFTFQL